MRYPCVKAMPYVMQIMTGDKGDKGLGLSTVEDCILGITFMRSVCHHTVNSLKRVLRAGGIQKLLAQGLGTSCREGIIQEMRGPMGMPAILRILKSGDQPVDIELVCLTTISPSTSS